MYKLLLDCVGDIRGVLRIADGAGIPSDPDNTDYQQFKKDVLEGAELQDADGNSMTPDGAKAFLATLP